MAFKIKPIKWIKNKGLGFAVFNVKRNKDKKSYEIEFEFNSNDYCVVDFDSLKQAKEYAEEVHQEFLSGWIEEV